MSELKSFDIVVAEEGYGEGIVKYRRAVYDKSEADKVIAEKDKEIAELKEQIEVLKNQACKMNCMMVKHYNEVCDDNIHQKYKRCLDKAEMCQAKYDEEDAKVNGHYSSWEYTSKEMKYWERWHKCWLELAEKFKEAK